jgi:hypothetical protein
MKIITLKARSSSGEHYVVEFEISEVIKVSCNCNAGMFGKLCRHKTGLLSGEHNLLYDLAEEPALDEVIKIVTRSEYMNLMDDLQSAKNAIDAAKKHEKKVKKSIELFLKEGIPLSKEN